MAGAGRPVGPSALERFGDDRNRIIGPLFDAADRIAGYGWDLAQVRRHMLVLNAAMSTELELIAEAAGASAAATGHGPGWTSRI